MPALNDVCIVGAGPAGLAVAIAAASRGMNVRVVDAAPEGPVDKACGEGLLPDALACLERLGVRGLRGRAFAGIRFHDAKRTVEARFPGSTGLGVRRTELHRAMLERAAELGVAVEWNKPFRGLDGAAFTIGADGGQSRVRAVSGLGEGRVTSRRIGLRQHFALAPWSDFVEVFWTGGAQAYVTPVADDQVGIAFLSDRKFSSVAAALQHFPELQKHLAGAPPRSTPRGAVTVTRRLPRVTTARVALAGDASGAVDAITGEGMNLCFRQAEALAGALASGDLRAYERAHIRSSRTARVMYSSLLFMGRSNSGRAGSMQMLSCVPWLFPSLLKIHIGHRAAKHPASPQGTALPPAERARLA